MLIQVSLGFRFPCKPWLCSPPEQPQDTAPGWPGQGGSGRTGPHAKTRRGRARNRSSSRRAASPGRPQSLLSPLQHLNPNYGVVKPDPCVGCGARRVFGSGPAATSQVATGTARPPRNSRGGAELNHAPCHAQTDTAPVSCCTRSCGAEAAALGNPSLIAEPARSCISPGEHFFFFPSVSTRCHLQPESYGFP